MTSKFTIFYAWQSDTKNSENKFFIEKCIKSAIDDKVNFIKVNRDTKGSLGAINIENELFKRIGECDLFIADGSIVGKYCGNEGTKCVPNSNVVAELGYAAGKIGWERVIIVFNEDLGNPNFLPFDLRQHRLCKYSIKKQGFEAAQTSLSRELSEIINKYYKIGTIPKKDFSLIKIKGFDFCKNEITSNLIGYPLRKYVNYLKKIQENNSRVKQLFSEIGDCKITKVNNSENKDSDLTGNIAKLFESQKIPCTPSNVKEVVSNLKKYFGIDTNDDYFSFGNLKQNTSIISVPGGGFNYYGTDEEMKKHNLYNELYNEIQKRVYIEKFVDCFNEYKIIPLVVHNDSMVHDDSITIDIKLKSSFTDYKFDNLVSSIANENDLTNIFNLGIVTDLFFNFDNEIKNDFSPEDHPKLDVLNRICDMTYDDCSEEFDNLVLLFESQKKFKSSRVEIGDLRSNEKKWVGKLLIVKTTVKISVRYEVKSNKSNGYLEEIISE